MGLIIAFEGHNGVGKTSVARELSNRLEANYFYGVDSDSLQNGLKDKFIKEAYWFASAIHFLAGSMETKRKINKTNDKNINILDRSFWSTLAVHWDRKDREKIIKVINLGKEFLPIPNLIFLLNASYDQCNNRIESKKNLKEKELDNIVDKNYFNKELDFYQWLLNNKDEQTEIISIDTNKKNIEEITDICEKYIRDRYF